MPRVPRSPLCAGCDSEKDAGSNVQRSCPVARDAVIPQVHESDGFDFIRTALGLACYCDKTLRRLSLDVRLHTQLHNTRAAFCSQVRRCCVRTAAFRLAQRPGLTCLMRHSMARRGCWISSRNWLIVTLPPAANPPDKRRCQPSAHFLQSGDSKSESSSESEALIRWAEVH